MKTEDALTSCSLYVGQTVPVLNYAPPQQWMVSSTMAKRKIPAPARNQTPVVQPKGSYFILIQLSQSISIYFCMHLISHAPLISSTLDHVSQREQITKLLTEQFFPASYHFVPIRSKYSPRHPFSFHAHRKW